MAARESVTTKTIVDELTVIRRTARIDDYLILETNYFYVGC